MKKEESRGSWYLLTGLVIGLMIGVIYSRNIQPVSYIDTYPSSLRREDKDRYRSLIASAYLSNGDLVRARARLELLGDKDISRTLTEQAQRILAENGSSSEAQALGMLALALGEDNFGVDPADDLNNGSSPVNGPPSAVQDTPVPGQADPSAPQSGTPGPGMDSQSNSDQKPADAIPPELFVLTNKQEICDEQVSEPIIVIQIKDQAGKPVAGIPITISWQGGEEHFYTGLKPEKGLGYADYTLNSENGYSLYLGETGATLRDIYAVQCRDPKGNSYWGVLSLEYSLPQ